MKLNLLDVTLHKTEENLAEKSVTLLYKLEILILILKFTTIQVRKSVTATKY